MMGFSPAELTDGEKIQQHIDCENENDGEINERTINNNNQSNRV